MKSVDPTKPHRKSGGWGTRRFVALTTVTNTTAFYTPRGSRCSSCNYNFGVGTGANTTFTCYRFLV